MTTSGVTTLTITRNDIIEMALEDLGVYAPDFHDPASGEYTRANKRLNMMIKAWQAAGIGLWLNTVYSQALTAAAQSYNLGPGSTPNPIARPIGVVEARIRDSAGNDTPLTPLNRDDYMKLPYKASVGTTNSYYFDPQMTNAVFYVWPVETDLTKTIKMTLRTPIEVFVNTDDTPHFPIEWADALHFNLAMRLIPAYKVPSDVAQSVKELALITLRDADDFDREQNVSVQMAPDLGY